MIMSYTLTTKQNNTYMSKQLELFTISGDQLELNLTEK